MKTLGRILGMGYVAALTVGLVVTGHPWWGAAVLGAGLCLVKQKQI